MKDNKHYDFLSSVVLIIIGVYIIASGVGIYHKAKEPLHVSPGLFPIILGCALILCSILLLISSLKDGGVKQRIEEIKGWAGHTFKEKATISMIVGTVIMGIYSFVLLSILPFWLGSLIFMIFLFIYLNAASVIKILILSGGSVLAIILLFQVLFRVPLS